MSSLLRIRTLKNGNKRLYRRLMALAMMLFLSLTGSTKAQSTAEADFTIHTQVSASAPPRFGFNLSEGGPGANIRDNALIRDGGFGSYDLRMDFYASDDGASDGTTFIATGTNAAAGWWNTCVWSLINSKGAFVEALARVYRFNSVTNSWSLVRTGTVTSMTAVSGSYLAADHTITFDTTGAQCRAGDAIWLSKDAVYQSPYDTMHWTQYLDPRFTNFNYSWNPVSSGQTWSQVTDVPSGEVNGQSVAPPLSMMITTGTAGKAGIWQYLSLGGTTTNVENFEVGHSYTVSLWLKQTGISGSSATFTCGIAGGALKLSATFTGITSTWQQYTRTFPSPGALLATGSIGLQYTGPGTLYVNQFQFYDASHNPFTLDPRVLQAFQNFKPGTIRIWSGLGNGSQNYAFWSLDSWLEDESVARGDIGLGQYHPSSNSYITNQQQKLPSTLALAAQLNAIPWLMCNLSWTEQEWSNFIDYLAAPAGVGYATHRPANHPGPYTADFSNIYLEFGNESWGTTKTAVINAYGQYAHYMFSQAIAGKSYYDPAKIKLILNGSPNGSFGEISIANCAEGQSVDHFLYTGGGTSGDAGFQSDLLAIRSYQSAIPKWMASAQASGSAGHPYEVTSYEGGPGSDSPDSTGSGDHSLAAAVGTLDTYLYAQQQGMTHLDFFSFRLGTGLYTSHGYFAHGFNPTPVWEALQMRNQYCAGDIVSTDNNLSPTTSDGNNTPLVAAYTFHEITGGTNYAEIVVISRDLNNNTSVALHLPVAPIGSATLYALTGDPRADNDASLAVPIITSTIPSFPQVYTFTMPAGSVYLFKVPTAAWPAAGPTDLTVKAGTGYVRLDWSAVSGATGYQIYRYTSPTGTAGTPYATATGGTTFLDTGVANGSTYYYKVNAVTSAGETDASTKVAATPAAAFQVIGVNCGGPTVEGTLWVSDTNISSNGSPYASGGFISTVGSQTIPASLSNPAPQAVYNTLRAKGTITIPGLTPGLAYTIRIHGDETFYTSPGHRLQNILFNGVTVDTNMDWFTVAGAKNTAAILTYQIIPSTSNLAVKTVASSANTDLNAMFSGIEVLQGAVPLQPINLTASSSIGQVTLNWSATPGADSCIVTYGTTSGIYTQTVPAVTGTTNTITGLTNGTKYYFQVTGTNADGFGARSVEVTATPASDLASGFVVRWNLDGNVSTPATTMAGNANDITVTALDAFGNVATGYTGTVIFNSTDTGTGASIPTAYTFTTGKAPGSDNGIHTFTSGVTLVTVGNQTVSVVGTTGSAGATLLITVRPSYFSWRHRWFTTSQLSNATVSDDVATPASDGIPNLMKYALNLNPMAVGVRGLPVTSVTTTGTDNYLTLTYTHVISAADITYVPEISSNLINWYSGPGYVSPVSTTNNADNVTQTVVIQDPTPIKGTNKKFIRLRVTRP